MAYFDARTEAARAATESRWIAYWERHVDVDPVDSWLRGDWHDRNWLNVPGPFYGAMTDTCRAGFEQAPRNVFEDERGAEFVWRQPRDATEVRAVLDAAYVDPFDGYAWDGDDYWTPDTVRAWWRDRAAVREWIDGRLKRRVAHDHGRREALRAFREHLEGEFEATLRGYVFWLVERREPNPGRDAAEALAGGQGRA